MNSIIEHLRNLLVHTSFRVFRGLQITFFPVWLFINPGFYGMIIGG